METSYTRRSFLRRSATAAGVAALAATGPGRPAFGQALGFGPLVQDPNGLLDLPAGFRYRVLQTVDDRLSNGAPVPGDFDGMTAVHGRDGETVLVRNHELRPGDIRTKAPVEGPNPYDPAAVGGTTALVLGPSGDLTSSYVTSSGTSTNCAGGGTPWGTWITCEEDRATGHGYAFEVNPRSPCNALSKTPIRAMGHFSHEAMDIDPRTGIAYLTEDDFRGNAPPPDEEVIGTARQSFLYRYLPHNRGQRPGTLQQGGVLQALGIRGRRQFNVDLGRTGERYRVVWITVGAADPAADALERGAARFHRLEGCHYAAGAFWFNDTSGGEKRNGQVFRLVPSGDPSGESLDTLELFLEGDSALQMDGPDNTTVTPWGDLWFAEDRKGANRIVALTPGGQTYDFASNRLVGLDAEGASELAGPCFSPGGRRFFVNIQNPGHTFLVEGPFPRPSALAQARMATAAPRHAWAPAVSPELAEYALKHGMSPHEAAAFERLGVPLA